MYSNKNELCPVDIAEFYNRLPSKQSIIKLLNDFVRAYPELLEEMIASVQKGDPESIKTAAHTLKGVLSNLSIKRASSLALDLENNADQVGSEDAIAVIQEIRSELIFLENYLQSDPPELEY